MKKNACIINYTNVLERLRYYVKLNAWQEDVWDGGEISIMDPEDDYYE